MNLKPAIIFFSFAMSLNCNFPFEEQYTIGTRISNELYLRKIDNSDSFQILRVQPNSETHAIVSTLSADSFAVSENYLFVATRDKYFVYTLVPFKILTQSSKEVEIKRFIDSSKIEFEALSIH